MKGGKRKTDGTRPAPKRAATAPPKAKKPAAGKTARRKTTDVPRGDTSGSTAGPSALPPRAVPEAPPAGRGGYEDHRDRVAASARRQSAQGREIGPLPEVADPDRKARCEADARLFCRTYFPRRFKLPFAECHFVAIDEMEACNRDGGLLAIAEPRGSGKTAIAECMLLRAILYGMQRFAVLVQATQPLAARSFKKIKRELETNPLLAEDFPEVCYPIRRLERINNRAAGQTLDGRPTAIEWTAESVTLPTVAGSRASGATIVVSGIEGAARGLSVLGPDGDIIRPGLVLVDDAQTRASAKSPTQTADREAVITDDIMGLAGPGESLALINLCTVIYPNDLSDRFLSPDKHPEFRHVRVKMIEQFPTRADLWDEYAEVRRESLRSGDRGRRATEFLRENFGAMHEGARLSWPDRVKKGDLSALQTAMNLYLTNPRGFKSEYQNEPEPVGGVAAAKEVEPDQVAARLSGLPRHEVPAEATRLTAMIDVGGQLHWYAVVAWDDHFGGSVIDYGCWPRQARAVFAASDPRPGLSVAYPQLGETQRVYAGLTDLASQILGRAYYREGAGGELRVERCLVDCGWNAQTVHQFCRQSQWATALYPSKGIGRTATARGVSEWKPRPGERSGWHWRLTLSETGRGRMAQFDPDAWKTFVFDRLTTAMGGRGCLTLFGKSAAAHELVAQHLAAETAEPVTVRGDTFDKWTLRPHGPDNHLLDCVVGAAVAAAVQGATWTAQAVGGPPAAKPREKVKLSEVYARKQAGRAR